ncbi:MAG: hypothetical protein RL076_324 [Chloroflexota bacterium]
MTTAMIHVTDVSFTYRRRSTPAIDAVSFSLQPGSVTAIIGKAGAGKSTLCALMAGFMPQFFRGDVTGTLRIDGRDPCSSSIIEMLPHVTMVTSQASTQISGVCFTVADEVGFALQNLGYTVDEITQRVQRAMTLMEISHLAERSPFQLSGGQQQRVVIAAALALSPPILILDEPTAQLDPPAVAALGETLQQLARNGQTIVVAEHHLDWVGRYAERVLVLNDGKLHADGAPDVILANPVHAEGRAYCVRYSAFVRQHGLWPIDAALAITPDAICETIRVDTPLPLSHPRTETVGTELMHIDNVHFSYPNGVTVLHGIQLRIQRGERIALLGRNGAGKSTLLRHFNGLLRPQTGRVVLAGRDIHKTAPGISARHASIVFQDVRNQLFAATIRDEVSFGPRTLGLAQGEIDQRVERALAMCGLSAHADTHPYDMPVAQRRLVATAATMALESDLVALDEPTAGLDEASITQLVGAMRHCHTNQRTVVLVSHDLNFCAAHTDRVILIKGGVVAIDARWDALDAHQIALLDSEVGLPLGFHVAQQRGVSPRTPLHQLLCDPQALV